MNAQSKQKSHVFSDLAIPCVFRWNGERFEKHDEQFALPLDRGDVGVVFFLPHDLIEIVSGQTRLKPGTPLYQGNNIIGYVKNY